MYWSATQPPRRPRDGPLLPDRKSRRRRPTMSRADLPYDADQPTSFDRFVETATLAQVQRTIIEFGAVLQNHELQVGSGSTSE